MKNLNKLILFVAAIMLFSCGDNKKKEEEKDQEQITVGNNESSTSTNSSTSDESNKSVADKTDMADDKVVEVLLTGNDQMQYNLDEIKVKAGQTVKLTLKHVGQMDKNVMGHNFVLLKPGTDVAKFAQTAVSAKDNDYIPQDSDKVITHTELLGGGESTTIEFEAPEKGTYDFICSFPGHYVQMHGKFIVE
ncbi:MAG: azurin [Salegentibacter sp.]